MYYAQMHGSFQATEMLNDITLIFLNDDVVITLWYGSCILVDGSLLRNLRHACVVHDLSLCESKMQSGS